MLQGCSFFCFFFNCFLSLLLKLCENARHAMNWGYCCNSFRFTNFTIDMNGFMDPHKVVVKRNAFLTFSSAWKWMMKQKVKSWSTNFHKWKRIWTYKRCLNWFPFQRKTPRNFFGWYLAPLLVNYTQWVCTKPLYTLIVP
jgi:hypothetical protein